MRADFDEDRFARLQDRLDRRPEPHRVADIAPPIDGVERVPGHQFAGHGGEKRNAGATGADFLQRALDAILDAIHELAVKRIVEREPVVGRPTGLEQRLHRGQVFAGARYGDTVGAVDGADGGAVAACLEQAFKFHGTHAHGGHRALAAGGALPGAAFAYQIRGLL